MKNVEVSVIVPIYNIESYLTRCLESLHKQDLEDIEFILVDDGSTDSCPQICDMYVKKDKRFKVIHKNNGGLVSARKAGISAATGDYIGYVDGDDWVESNMFSEMAAIAKKTSADVVVSGFYKDIIWDDENIIFSKHHNNIADGVYEKEDIIHQIQDIMMYNPKNNSPDIFSYLWNKLFRRTLIFDIQLEIDETITIGEDAACVYPTIVAAERITVCNNSFYHYIQRPNSMLKEIKTDWAEEIKKIESFYRCTTRIFSSLKKEELSAGVLYYAMYLLASRTGGILDNSGSIVSLYFDTIQKDSNVVICGAGTMGQHLYRRLKMSGYANVKKWLDPDYSVYQKQGLDVIGIDEISIDDNEYILLAALDAKVARQFEEKLIKNGIPKKRIIHSSVLEMIHAIKQNGVFIGDIELQ